jgi:hypothetical protein
MKKLLMLPAIGVLCLSMVGCIGDKGTPDASGPSTQSTAPAKPGDSTTTAPSKPDDGQKTAPTPSTN